jgi:hypothetical protein
MLQKFQMLQVLRMLQGLCWNRAIGDGCFWKAGMVGSGDVVASLIRYWRGAYVEVFGQGYQK